MTRITSSKRLLSVALVAVTVLSCDGGPSGLTTGNLSISVSGLPSGTSAAVMVSGPDGYSQSVSGTQTLTQLTAGIYTVAASNVTVGTATYAPSPSSQTVSVSSSASVAVTYSASSPTLGSLLVNINGLPSGADAAITVTSPNGYNQSLTTTQTLTSLTPGTYTISAQDVVAPGGTPYTASPPSQDVAVVASATATRTVSYSPPSGGSLNLRIDGMYLTQSTQTYAGAVPLVQNRDGYLRVFVVANVVNAVAPSVRVRYYQDLVFQSERIIPAPGLAVPTAVDESSMSYSWNLLVPGTLIRPGLSIVAEVDPSNTVFENNESDNAYPAAAPQAMTVRTMPTLNVTLVPIHQLTNGLVGNVSNPNALLALTRAMHPIDGVNVVVRQALQTSTELQEDGTGWGTVLNELNAARIGSGSQSSRYWYGVAKVSYASGVAGIAYVSEGSAQRTAMGWDYTPSGGEVAAHELGHNWGRNHAPCGGPAQLDPQYPHPDGSTGVYGLDVASQTLKQPTLSDIMGYCDPKWIGDYSYKAVLNYLSPPSPVVMSASGSEVVQPTLLVWGHIRDGQIVLEPAFQVTTRPSLPGGPGSYSIEGRSEDGLTLFRFSFTPDEVADDPRHQKNFAFAMPLPSATVARISTLRLSGPAGQAVLSTRVAAASGAQLNTGARADSVEVRRVTGGLGLRWNSRAHPVIMVRDPETGEVLSFARGGDVRLSTHKDEVELLLSDGVRSRAKRMIVAR
jgi:hypothetical protein